MVLAFESIAELNFRHIQGKILKNYFVVPVNFDLGKVRFVNQ